MPAAPATVTAMAQDPASGCRVWKPALHASESVRWSGPCAGGAAEGDGRAEWFENGKNTLTYEGTFRSGMLQGNGAMTGAGGDRYVGEYRDGKRDGQGAYISSTGERYEGQWHDNKREGHGVLVRADGTRFEGVFKDGRPQDQVAR